MKVTLSISDYFNSTWVFQKFYGIYGILCCWIMDLQLLDMEYSLFNHSLKKYITRKWIFEDFIFYVLKLQFSYFECNLVS